MRSLNFFTCVDLWPRGGYNSHSDIMHFYFHFFSLILLTLFLSNSPMNFREHVHLYLPVFSCMAFITWTVFFQLFFPPKPIVQIQRSVTHAPQTFSNYSKDVDQSCQTVFHLIIINLCSVWSIVLIV